MMAETAEWDEVLSRLAQMPSLAPGAVLAAGPAFRPDFTQVLEDLEAVAGWRLDGLQSGKVNLGNLDGVDTTVRQVIRQAPLETTTYLTVTRTPVTLPTPPEMARIRAALILKRNALRDYVDFAALSALLGEEALVQAFESFDRLYPQPSGASAMLQLVTQIMTPVPHDPPPTDDLRAVLPDTHGPWSSWNAAMKQCRQAADTLFSAMGPGDEPAPDGN